MTTGEGLSHRSPPPPDANGPGSEFLADLSNGQGAVHDTVTVGGWTAVSRATGVLRVLLIAAVLGPTYLGNAYQLTNALPNLLFYGFLGGSLFSSLLVPSLVGHLDRGSRTDVQRVAGGLLGVVMVIMCVLAPIALVALPLVLQLMAPLSDANAADQAELAQWLLLMTVPQVLGYAVAGTCAAVMNAQRKYALAAAAPAVENVGIIAVLLLVREIYGPAGGGDPARGELLLLGLGSTAAVAVHAALQWWGASRCGVRLRPRMGWRDAEVTPILRRALPSLTQSGLVAAQILALLVVASSVAGGTVAFQIALNFYALPISLVATPVAFSLLPRLSRLVGGARSVDFSDTFVRGLRLVLFLTLPAATGYLVLAGPIATTVAGGRMATADGTAMITWAMASVAVGLVGQSVFFVTAQAAYARHDTRTPLRSMVLQAVVCLVGCLVAVQAEGVNVLIIGGLFYSVANIVAALHLVVRVRRSLAVGTERLRPALIQILGGCVAMAVLSGATATVLAQTIEGRPGAVVSLLAASVVGLLTFGILQHRWHSQEARWLLASIGGRRLRSAGARTIGT